MKIKIKMNRYHQSATEQLQSIYTTCWNLSEDYAKCALAAPEGSEQRFWYESKLAAMCFPQPRYMPSKQDIVAMPPPWT